MIKPQWMGVYPALTTSFYADGSLDLDGFAFKCQAQIEAGVHGLIVGGSLGESSTLTQNERLALLNTAHNVASPSVPTILNIAEGSTKSAIDLANKAQEHGADGLMLLPPMMYKPTRQETIDFLQTSHKVPTYPFSSIITPLITKPRSLPICLRYCFDIKPSRQ